MKSIGTEVRLSEPSGSVYPLVKFLVLWHTCSMKTEKTTLKTPKHSHHRFVCMTEAVDFLTEKFNWTRQESVHFVWDNEFTVGTDRAIWLTLKETV